VIVRLKVAMELQNAKLGHFHVGLNAIFRYSDLGDYRIKGVRKKGGPYNIYYSVPI
jgi:hypothetical protein